jgi:hypothetical protein
MPSAAMRRLETERLPEVRALTQLDPTRTKGARGDPLRVNAVNRGAAVLLSAHLQGFLEDLVVEMIDTLNSSGRMKSEMPPTLMAVHLERHLADLTKPTELIDRLTRVERLFDQHGFYWDDCAIEAGMLDAGAVTRLIGNPWPGVMKRVMRIFGGEDPFNDPSLSDPRDVERRLKELVGKRNDIAHGSGEPPVTYEQIDRYIDASKTVARVLDDQGARLLQQACGLSTRPWP